MICIIGSETTKNYGLFRDISRLPDYLIVYALPPVLYGTIPWRILRRLKPDLLAVYLRHMPCLQKILDHLERLDRMIVVDTALRWLDEDFLNHCKASRPDLQIDCLLLNSTKSWTFTEPRLHSRFSSFKWDTVLTTDPEDAKTYGWKYTGLHYYSKTPLPAPRKIRSDVFLPALSWAGGGKRFCGCLTA